MSKKDLSERDICTKFITPALVKAGWDIATQIREEFPLTAGRIIVRGKMHKRAENKRADYVLFYKPNMPIAVIEAKDNNRTIADGMQQALGYAAMLEVPFVFSSNGDGFLFHNTIALDGKLEKEIALDDFPSPAQLWNEWKSHRGIDPAREEIINQDYYSGGTDKTPRYYQLLAINKTTEAIANGQNRILLVMATGTGKTFTAFQIIWRLWKSKAKKRILFLADRNILVDQTMTNDFKPFGSAMTKIQKRQTNKSYAIYLSLYQAVSGTEEEQNIYKNFSPGFFDLVIVDECHQGSAKVYGGNGNLRVTDRLCNWCREITVFRLYERLHVFNDPATAFASWIKGYLLKFYRKFGFMVPGVVPQVNSDGAIIPEASQ
ncbi:MAG: DEAD/DEAH box helicase family protein [Spirochaetales bacterium]|nr:DEAD/DEAH box helicase family protein [Spirochaetales bacterium]